jgi:branched-chain amino acid transport system substrate-binding protein
MTFRNSLLVAAAAVLALAVPASAQTVKVGFIATFSGLNANMGEYMDRAAKLYMKLHDKDLPPGVKVELIVRDDGGANPERGKQVAQELITRDKVQLLAGVIFTPVALAIAPLTVEAKIPLLISNAGTSVITTRSPYIARFSFTLWQSSYPFGAWAAKHYKSAYEMTSDYAPGHDAEEAFAKSFKEGGGNIVGAVRVPLENPDFAAYLQRVKDAKPDALFVFVPAGKTATAVMKGFGDLGLKAAGIKLIGPGDITPDEELPNMGDVALGVITAFHYSADADRPANKAFVSEYKKAYGKDAIPDFISVGTWDTLAAIYYVVREQKGHIDPDKTMELLKHYKNPNSPRGPISIDPETRDIVQNEYLREVKMVNGHLANVELETIGTAVKDPWKQFNPPK